MTVKKPRQRVYSALLSCDILPNTSTPEMAKIDREDIELACPEQRPRYVVWTWLAFAMILSHLGCGGSPPNNAAAPMVITSVSPLPTLNNPAFTMDVLGSGFLSNAVVLINGSSGPLLQVPTAFIDSTHLTAAVPTNAFAIPAPFIYVYSPTVPNCSNQYCGLGYWSNAFQIQLQPGP